MTAVAFCELLVLAFSLGVVALALALRVVALLTSLLRLYFTSPVAFVN